MEELLKYGGDVEVRDARHLQPLSLTNNYEVRCVLGAQAFGPTITSKPTLLPPRVSPFLTLPLPPLSPLPPLPHTHPHRKLLLGTVLLCAAAEAGDYNEVERLLSTTACSPNACGLRHKNALHLASSRGHQEVVEFLIVNGVRE